MNETERAERIQAWKAFLIPSSLFVACLLNAAGIYILYNGSALGVVFIGAGIATITAGLFGFVTFQNKRRAKGQWKKVSEVEVATTANPDDDELPAYELREEAAVK